MSDNQQNIPKPSELNKLGQKTPDAPVDAAPETEPEVEAFHIPESEVYSHDVTLVFSKETSGKFVATADDYNIMFARQTSNLADDMLQARGYFFLNELNALLNLKLTPQGQILGWIKNDELPTRIKIDIERDGDAILLKTTVQGEIFTLL